MRMQTIATRFDAPELLAPPVDATGWLTGPPVNEAQRAGWKGVDRQDVEGHPDTTSEPATDRRADGRLPAATEKRRSADRSGRVRHQRRVRMETLRSAPLRRGRPATARLAAPEQSSAPGQAVSGQVVSDQMAPDRSAPQGYRMGRWARLTLTITVLAATVVVVASLITPASPRALVDVTVAPGDTLWSIATQAAPDRDPRDVIDEIKQLNDMRSGVLPIGVVLRVPAMAE